MDLLKDMRTLLIEADNYALGAFEFWSVDSVMAILAAAEECGKPVILQASPLELNFMGWGVVERAVTYLAEQSSVSVALHLDHADDIKWVKMAIDSGFTSVMIDASHHCFDENVAITKEVISMARPHGITVESELGRLPGAEGAISVEESEAYQTSVEEAVEFVKQTQVDALAVAVGTVHGFYKTKPSINVERIAQLNTALDVPLVLHGGSGTPDDKIVEAIKAGIRKINVCTEFMDAYGNSYYDSRAKEDYRPTVKGLFEPAMMAGKEIIKQKIKLFS